MLKPGSKPAGWAQGGQKFPDSAGSGKTGSDCRSNAEVMKAAVTQTFSVSAGPKKGSLFWCSIEIANLAYWQRYRGFESLPLRQNKAFSTIDDAQRQRARPGK